jgi:drug/metabolite transporter (DMT)-like permease
MIGLTSLALLASVLLGVSDFLGGTISRRVKLVTVLLLSQVVGTVAVLPRLFVESPLTDAGPALLWGVIGGVATAIAVACLFRALAIGTMGVVAPITALGVVVPAIAGIARGDSLTPLLGIGLLVAVAGTVLASGPELRRRGEVGSRSILLAVVAALGFGVANLSVALGSAHNVTTTLLSNSLVVLVLYGIAALVLRTPPVARGGALVGIAAIGILGISANLCFALASQAGDLSIVAVLASLYPVVTVLLGWRVFKEKLQRIQILGVAAVFVGIATVAWAGGR